MWSFLKLVKIEKGLVHTTENSRPAVQIMEVGIQINQNTLV